MATFGSFQADSYGRKPRRAVLVVQFLLIGASPSSNALVDGIPPLLRSVKLHLHPSRPKMEPYRLTATEVITKIGQGDLTVEQYAQSLLSRIQERDHVVRAWAYLDPEYVMRQARELDCIAPENRGPLHGVAVAVKDVMYTKGTFHAVYSCHTPC